MNIALLLKFEIGALHKTNLGGTEQIYLEDISEFTKRGHKVTAYARFDDTPRSIHHIPYGQVVLCTLQHCQWLSRTRLSKPYHALHNALLQLLDLYYTYQFSRRTHDKVCIGYSTPLLPLFTKTAIVLFQNADYRFFGWKVLKQRYVNGIYLFCSKYLLHRYRQRYPFLTNRNSFVLYNAVNTKNFTPPKRYHDNLTKPIKLLYCGAWAPEKGLGVLLRALVYIQRSNPNMYTLTITSNPHMWYTDFPSIDASYIRMVRQLIRKVSGVTLLGGLKREELPQIYHAHDYTLMPSMWEEPFGLVALESIASGTPVIAFRSGGLPEILASSNAFLLEKKIGALQQVLQRIAQRNKGVQKPVHLTNKNKHMHMDYRIAKFSVYINSILLHEPDMTARNS